MIMTMPLTGRDSLAEAFMAPMNHLLDRLQGFEAVGAALRPAWLPTHSAERSAGCAS